MKKRKRLLSMILSASIASSFMLNGVQLKNTNAAPSGMGDISEIEVLTPSDAIRVSRAPSTETLSGTADELSALNWEHVGNGKGKVDDNIGALRALLESSEAKKIVLTEDITENYQKSLWKEIYVQADKVLDLNGHTIKFSDDTNRTGDYKQSSNSDDFRDSLIEIKDGTLTIIDSSKEQTGCMFIDGYMINPYLLTIPLCIPFQEMKTAKLKKLLRALSFLNANLAE